MKTGTAIALFLGMMLSLWNSLPSASSAGSTLSTPSQRERKALALLLYTSTLGAHQADNDNGVSGESDVGDTTSRK